MSDQAFWALLGTIFGGAGLAIVTKILNRNKDKYDLGAAMRDELRKDNESYRKEIDELSRRVDGWAQKYAELDSAYKKTIAAMQVDIEKMQEVLIKNGIDYPPHD